jgi:hypothetical protein
LDADRRSRAVGHHQSAGQAGREEIVAQHHSGAYEKRDRRDRRAREAVVAAVASTFDDTLTLSLTPAQTARLLDLRIDFSNRVLADLAQRGVLHHVDGRYRRRADMARAG